MEISLNKKKTLEHGKFLHKEILFEQTKIYTKRVRRKKTNALGNYYLRFLFITISLIYIFLEIIIIRHKSILLDVRYHFYFFLAEGTKQVF